MSASPPDVVHTAAGSPQVARAVQRAGAIVGNGTDDVELPDDVRVDFLDWPFDKPYQNWWNKHLARVRRNRPKIVVAPDIQEGTSPESVYEKGDRLLERGAEVVVVVPKDIRPSEVPDKFRVGLPFAKRFGAGGVSFSDRLWQDDSGQQATLTGDVVRPDHNVLDDFFNVGDVHVLGGAPHDQLRLRKFPIDIQSLDTSRPWTYASRGRRVWFREGQIVWPDLDAYDALEASIRNVMRAWGYTVEPKADLPGVIRDLLELPADRRREEFRLMMRRGPPPVDADTTGFEAIAHDEWVDDLDPF